jgi:Glyoxalase superfamily protein
MRDFRDAKTMARTLRAALAAKGFKVTVSQSLELIAEAFGAADWNTLAAAIRREALTPGKNSSRRPPPIVEWAPTRSLELALHRAIAHAGQRGHEYTWNISCSP